MNRKLLPLIISLLLGGIAAAQVPISGLPPATTPLSGAEQLPVVQGGTTKKATVGNITASAPALNATYLLRSSSVLLPNSRTLAGTAAEILLMDGGAGSALTLSTPQPIATTSTPTFAGLTLGTPLTVPNGGTGALTLSGVLKGNGVSAFSSATSSDVISLWSGCAAGTPLLSFSGSCVSAGVPAGSNTQVQYNNSGAFGASSLFTFNSGSVVLNLGASTTPGTFSVGTLDTMIINGVQVPIPSFAANSNIQGVIENHSYVNGVASGGARYYGVRSEGTLASPLIVSNGDHLSTFLAAGYNGTAYSLGGQIQFLVDGTPGASAMPTDLDFAVSVAGSQTPTSRLTLKTDGSYSVSGAVGSAGNLLRSAGAGAAAGWSTTVFPNSAATGNLLYASASNTYSNLSDVAVGSYLRSGGVTTAPVWSNITIPNITTFGDVWYGSASNVMTPLAGNTTTSKLFFTQTGTGTVSAGPVWTAILASDLPGSFSGFANPSASVGLTIVNGAATTAMRSDAAPALDTTISPTMTGLWNFTNTSGTQIRVLGVNTAPASTIAIQAVGDGVHNVVGWTAGAAVTPEVTYGTSATGWSKEFDVSVVGVQTNAGLIGPGPHNITGMALRDLGMASIGGNTVLGCNNGSIICFSANANDTLSGYGITAAGQVDMSPDTGTFTSTYTGFTTTVTCTSTWAKMGKVVVLTLCTATGTSNAVTFSMTGLPSAIQTALAQTAVLPSDEIDDAGSLITASTDARLQASSGTILFRKAGNTSGWTNTGTKGFLETVSIVYQIQ